MPKITTKKYTIAGKAHEVSVWYTETNQFHFKNFPPEVGRLAGNTEQYRLNNQPTAHALYFAADEAIKIYEEKIKQTRKVIVYEVKAPDGVKATKNGYRTIPLPNCEWVGYAGDRDDFGFMVNYKILYAIESGEKREFRYVQEDDSAGHVCHSVKGRIIDYSPEREQFFINLRSAFQKLFLQTVSFLHDPEKLVYSIDSGQVLLMSTNQ